MFVCVAVQSTVHLSNVSHYNTLNNRGQGLFFGVDGQQINEFPVNTLIDLSVIQMVSI